MFVKLAQCRAGFNKIIKFRIWESISGKGRQMDNKNLLTAFIMTPYEISVREHRKIPIPLYRLLPRRLGACKKSIPRRGAGNNARKEFSPPRLCVSAGERQKLTFKMHRGNHEKNNLIQWHDVGELSGLVAWRESGLSDCLHVKHHRSGRWDVCCAPVCKKYYGITDSWPRSSAVSDEKTNAEDTEKRFDQDSPCAPQCLVVK